MTARPTGRAGRYVRQPSGYWAFVPAPLPPEPPLKLDGKLASLLSEADRALGRLDGSVLTLPNADLFVFMYVRKEAVLSSQIEGTQSSIQDVLAAEAQLMDDTTPRDVDEVINYVAAMKHGLARLDELPLSLRLIREIHGVLMKGARGGHLTPGEFRRTQNWLGPAGSTISTATFVPPPPDMLAEYLGPFETFLHGNGDVPPLVRIGLAHVQFETIHPFLDGNGRVGRLLITFLLAERQILRKPVLYLSHYLKRHRQEYYDRLNAVRTDGDWEGWLAFFLKGIVETAGEAADTARKILALREQHRSAITEHLGRGAGSGHKVLESLYERPIVSVTDVQKRMGATYAAANTLVRSLERMGILTEITGYARNRRFRYEPYVRLFTDGVPEAGGAA